MVQVQEHLPSKHKTLSSTPQFFYTPQVKENF
jgi:hypothetical protein